MKKLTLCLFIFQFLSLSGFCQNKDEAPWISYPSANVTEYGVYHFRKKLSLEQVPETLVIHISADNRYNLFVNGKRVCYGPAKGDLKTYKYDIIDIAPFLKQGENILATVVHNAGKDKPLALLSVQTAFFLRSEDEKFKQLDTNETWKVLKNEAYQPVSYYEMLFKERWFYGFYACGPGDEVFGEKYPWGWEELSFDDKNWKNAEKLDLGGNYPWKLVPRNIAFMDDHREKPAKIRKVTGIDFPNNFLNGNTQITIPANTKASIIFDYELFTMGYPELTVSGGKGSAIQLKYAEALYEKVNLKAHRDSVEGKTMFGVWDVFHPDGNGKRMFRPLWKRAFRYVQMNVETGDQPLEVLALESEYSGYPYPKMSTFNSNNARLNEIFEMSLQTFRMCSGETYYDTPFYEQLSYGGDNRPIGAISTYNSTDDRLFREVMRLYPQSENRETGLFKSAYPSRFDFDMGSWSLAWIQSLHDYYFIRGDAEYVSQFKDNIEKVLGFYHRHLDESKGILGTVKNQNFIDWSITKGSIPRKDENGEMTNSILLTLYYVHSLDCTVRLFNQIGLNEEAKKWEAEAKSIKAAVFNQAWNMEKGLFADYPGSDIFSQHTNLMAILCDVITPAQQGELMDKILTYPEFTEMASSYFSFFLFKALQKTGKEDLFLENLDFWYTYIDRGHTTCGETGFASHDRSDCHAWSAHPAYYLMSLTCGIQPADIGFQHVKIKPHLGDLTNIQATMPHPKGEIAVNYTVKKGVLKAEISLPKGLSGEWEYKGISQSLKEGVNQITVK
ncbi:family 78 glycoside hydrolase catalytic domain [Flexithrix dorotheae]|uniref:family 78 glycoside hydrolase catalytic domain n=1 Tax=Flexithrix dorotheae TaxID=70993 RepID=UPI00035FA323|nr:family 78 glycoside hydrolase catalytic domain [Flexithrix dorotheae]